MHIKSHWNKRAKEQSIEKIASAIGFISWKIATQHVQELENKGYKIKDDAHSLQVIQEFLAFLLQVSDRLAYQQMDNDTRQRFVTALALHMADTFTDNQHDILGKGEYRQAFIDILNQRAEDYAEFSFRNGEAGFDFLRYFGEQVAIVLVDKHFVSQQIMDINGPEAIEMLKKSLQNLLQ